MGRIRALNVGLDGVVGGLWGVVGAGKMSVSVESEWYFFWQSVWISLWHYGRVWGRGRGELQVEGTKVPNLILRSVCYQVGYIAVFLMRCSILIRYRRELHK